MPKKKREPELGKKLQLLVKEWNGAQVDSEGFADVAHPECDPFMVGARVFVQPHSEALTPVSSRNPGSVARTASAAGFFIS